MGACGRQSLAKGKGVQREMDLKEAGGKGSLLSIMSVLNFWQIEVLHPIHGFLKNLVKGNIENSASLSTKRLTSQGQAILAILGVRA